MSSHPTSTPNGSSSSEPESDDESGSDTREIATLHEPDFEDEDEGLEIIQGLFDGLGRFADAQMVAAEEHTKVVREQEQTRREVARTSRIKMISDRVIIGVVILGAFILMGIAAAVDRWDIAQGILLAMFGLLAGKSLFK